MKSISFKFNTHEPRKVTINYARHVLVNVFHSMPLSFIRCVRLQTKGSTSAPYRRRIIIIGLTLSLIALFLLFQGIEQNSIIGLKRNE